MENRLKLNKVPSYKSDLFTVKQCRRSVNGFLKPEDEPDVRLCGYGSPLMEVLTYKEKSKELWVYFKNKEDIQPFIDGVNSIDWLLRKYGGYNQVDRAGSPSFESWRLEKALIEEFYGK